MGAGGTGTGTALPLPFLELAVVGAFLCIGRDTRCVVLATPLLARRGLTSALAGGAVLGGGKRPDEDEAGLMRDMSGLFSTTSAGRADVLLRVTTMLCNCEDVRDGQDTIGSGDRT